MEEKELNTIIKNSLSWGFKIPDSQTGAAHIKLCFDGFGVLGKQSFYWEAKYSNHLQSFNFSELKEHQINNLVTIKTLNKDFICVVIIGVQVYKPKRELRVYIFDDPFELKKRKLNKKSILKKEFESTNYILVHKKLIDFQNYFKEEY